MRRPSKSRLSRQGLRSCLLLLLTCLECLAPTHSLISSVRVQFVGQQAWRGTACGGSDSDRVHAQRYPQTSCSEYGGKGCHAKSPPSSSTMLWSSSFSDATSEMLDASNLSNSSGQDVEILYETDHVLIIDKPHDVSHHNEVDHMADHPSAIDVPTDGIVTLLRKQLKRQRLQSATEKDEDGDVDMHVHQSELDPDSTPDDLPFRLYGVHRLDKVTSGILVFAKSSEMAQYLSKQFRDKTVVKYYVGLSARKPKAKKQGWVRGVMARSRNKSWKLLSGAKSGESRGRRKQQENSGGGSRKEHGDESQQTDAAKDSTPSIGADAEQEGQRTDASKAVTRFFTAGMGNVFPASSDAKDGPSSVLPKTCILFRPYTGKTHQLRVAAKSVGLPLLGDPIYSSTEADTRCCLHAAGMHIPMDDFSQEEPDITVWCYPKFHRFLEARQHLGTSNDSDADNGDGGCDADDSINAIVSSLLQKHCDEPALLQAAMKERATIAEG